MENGWNCDGAKNEGANGVRQQHLYPACMTLYLVFELYWTGDRLLYLAVKKRALAEARNEPLRNTQLASVGAGTGNRDNY